MPRRSGEAAKAGLSCLRTSVGSITCLCLAGELRRGQPSEFPSGGVGEKNSRRLAVDRTQELPPSPQLAVGIPTPFDVRAVGASFAFNSSMDGNKRFVYVLRNSDEAAHFDVGLTSDVKGRMADHAAGRCPHTASRRPWRLHVVIEFSEEARAIRFERYLKSGSGRAFAKRHFEP